MTEHPKITPKPIPFIDLAAQRRRLGSRIEDAVARVVSSGQYILGPEVGLLEADLAQFCGAKQAITCANGTDALALVLMAKNVKAGDAVICPSFTFAATAEVVTWVGATPVFVDVRPDTFNMDARSLAAGIAKAKQLGLNPVGLIPVDLFGQPVDFDELAAVANAHGLWILIDAAQSFGASLQGRKVGTLGLATATSFYPSKPLGAYGDGGAVFTDNAEIAALLKSLRHHGAGSTAYDHVRIGLNSRLDTIQAAVLIEKLKIFADEIDKRNAVAARYSEALKDAVEVPVVAAGNVSAWAQYTIKLPVGRREAVAATLKAQGVPTAIHYPKPLHQQPAYRDYPMAGNGLPVSEALAQQVLSLPMHPYLDVATQDYIVSAVRAAVR